MPGFCARWTSLSSYRCMPASLAKWPDWNIRRYVTNIALFITLLIAAATENTHNGRRSPLFTDEEDTDGDDDGDDVDEKNEKGECTDNNPSDGADKEITDDTLMSIWKGPRIKDSGVKKQMSRLIKMLEKENFIWEGVDTSVLDKGEKFSGDEGAENIETFKHLAPDESDERMSNLPLLACV